MLHQTRFFSARELLNGQGFGIGSQRGAAEHSLKNRIHLFESAVLYIQAKNFLRCQPAKNQGIRK
jgi:hypothetical protein